MGETKQSQLLRLCSHFAYGAGAAASVDAGSECKRILVKKRRKDEQAMSRIDLAVAVAELLWRGLPPSAQAQVQADSDQPAAEPVSHRRRILQALTKRFGTEEDTDAAAADVAPALPELDQASQSQALAKSEAECEHRRSPSTPEEVEGAEASSLSRAKTTDSMCLELGALVLGGEVDGASPPVELAPMEKTPPSAKKDRSVPTLAELRSDVPAAVRNSTNATVAGIASALEVARLLPSDELWRRSGISSKDKRDDCGSCESSRSMAALRQLRSGCVVDLELAGSALRDAETSITAAVEGYDAATRSLRFFERALAATQGEASAEERACSICLDDDIPCEQLAITVCAHVFHAECLTEVVQKFGTCPVCRHKLDLARDVTRLSAELQEAAPAPAARPRCKGPSGESQADLARKFGSKLAAMAAHLQEIGRKGEKAIVFCQWEDLKRKIADALGAFGIAYFQLEGSIYKRGESLRRFQEERGEDVTRVLLLSLEHSASGTNLTAANHVIFVHPMCALSAERAVAHEAQAIGRCRRWGQEMSEVHCWRFVTRGTIEETITSEHQRDLWRHHLSSSGAGAADAAGSS